MKTGLKSVAYHEAGHAVMNMIANCEFECVSIYPMAGGALYGTEVCGIYLLIMLYLSGKIAEDALCQGESTPNFDNTEPDTDFHYLMKMIMAFCHTMKEGVLFYKWCHARAAFLLSIHWPAVEGIAAELLKKYTITYEEALKIFNEAPKKHQKPKLTAEWKKPVIAP